MGIKTAKWITAYYIRKGIIKEEDREVYEYCFQLFLSAVVNGLIPVVAAVATGRIWETILYTAGFWPVRVLAGGYHAKTPFRCLLMTQAFYFAFLLSLLISTELQFWATILFAIVTPCTVFLLAPIASENKPLEEKQRPILKRKSRITVCVIAVIAIGGLYTKATQAECYSLAVGLVVAATSLILAKKSEVKIEEKKYV